MTMRYQQNPPQMSRDGVVFPALTLYSGHGVGLNAPDCEALHDVGPIPRGQYRIVAWHDSYEDKGPCVAQLEPVAPFDALGRSGFLIHGPRAGDQMDSSHGCIVADHTLRGDLRDTGDMDLLVV